MATITGRTGYDLYLSVHTFNYNFDQILTKFSQGTIITDTKIYIIGGRETADVASDHIDTVLEFDIQNPGPPATMTQKLIKST